MTNAREPNAKDKARTARPAGDEGLEVLRVNGQPPRILVAEDDSGMRVMLMEALQLAGCEVVECRDGLELLERLVGFAGSQKAFEYDLIISDIRMPFTSGMDVLRGMREYTGYPPIILVTGFGDERTRDTARKLGAAAVLAKPFELADLMALVRSCLSRDTHGSYHRRPETWETQWAAF
jgi:DNA-binding response OmpR family regulator